MRSLNRRTAVKMAAGLAVGTAITTETASDAAAPPNAAAKPKDAELASAQQHLSMYMLNEEVTVQLNGDGRSRDLIITSARDESLKPLSLHVRSATMRVFRADPDKDEYTKSGGIYWTFNGQEGKAQFKKPGALILVMRDHKDTVRFYTLVRDMRC